MPNQVLTQLLGGVAIGVLLMSILWNVVGVSGIAAVVSDRVSEYCRKPVADRTAIRDEINERLAPNSVVLTCEGDASP